MDNFMELKLEPTQRDFGLYDHDQISILLDGPKISHIGSQFKQNMDRDVFVLSFTFNPERDVIYATSSDMSIYDYAIIEALHEASSDSYLALSKAFVNTIRLLAPSNQQKGYDLAFGPIDLIKDIMGQAIDLRPANAICNSLDKTANQALAQFEFPPYMIDTKVAKHNYPTSWATAIKNLTANAAFTKEVHLIASSNKIFRYLDQQYEWITGNSLFTQEIRKELSEKQFQWRAENRYGENAIEGVVRYFQSMENLDRGLAYESGGRRWANFDTYWISRTEVVHLADRDSHEPLATRYKNIFSPATPDEQIEEMAIPDYDIKLEDCVGPF